MHLNSLDVGFLSIYSAVALLSVEAVRTFEEWKRILRTSDEIRKICKT